MPEFARRGYNGVMNLAAELGAILSPDRVLADEGALRAYDCDAYAVERNYPTAIVLPESTEETARIVRWCVVNRIPFTARGAGTGLSGGVLPAKGGVVISTKRMNRILAIDLQNRTMRAQAGIANKRLTDAVRANGLHFAPDPSSQTVSTLGGNIGENAGGPHTLKYGVTLQHIEAVTLVEPSGEVVQIARSSGFDFLALIVGGEGTLGVVTEAVVKLTRLPKAVETCLIAFPEVRMATEAVAEIIKSGLIPAALELVDHGIMGALQAAFGLVFPEGSRALLLVECDGEDADLVKEEMGNVAEIARSQGAIDVTVAQNETERAKLWTARKKGVGAMGRLAPSVVTHDGVIPRSKLPEMLDSVYRIAAEKKVGVANIFHAGDGNLHPCFYFDDRDPAQVKAVVEAGEAVIDLCLSLGGSITGEHGVGVEKLDLMERMFTPQDLELQAMAKRIFNDDDLCNPCKVLPNQRSCVEHRVRWRGTAW
ncbi:FAD-binding protein [bacterium]|nr:MAG: FAD-binding protein [bacterium]